MNDKEIINISTEDVEIIAAVKVKGQTLQCVIRGVERKKKSDQNTTIRFDAV